MKATDGYGDYYWFYINGLGFKLYLGTVPAEAKKLCAFNNSMGPVVVDEAFGRMVYGFLRDILDSSEKSESVVNLTKNSEQAKC